MISRVELRRITQEWRTRLQRVQQILQPSEWGVDDWNRFARALSQMVRAHGSTWTEGETTYWDVRWTLHDGGELICQAEDGTDGKKTLVVAQTGGFAEGLDNYTWFYGEFGQTGDFLGNPYWVDGTWKEALAMMLLPQQAGAGFYLSGGNVGSAPMLNAPSPSTQQA